MFDKLRNIIDVAKNIDDGNVFREVWSQEDVQEFIINLNTKNQLYDLGIDSNGVDLGVYTPNTIMIRKAENLPYDHVMLYFSGVFYDSFYIVPNEYGFVIEAETEKDDVDLAEKYGEAILGLTAESKQELINFVLKRVADEIKYRLLHG